MERIIDSDGLALAAHLARPPGESAELPTLVLAHGFPAGPGGATLSGKTYPDLADRLSAETGWAVLTFNFRGAGESPGNFSVGGWYADLLAALDHASSSGAKGVWLAGSSAGAALAICLAAEDERVRGVVSLAAPASFTAWATNPRRFLEECRQVGVITEAGFPPDTDAWNRELVAYRAIEAVAEVAPRSLLLLHGTNDETVPLSSARELAAAAGKGSELRTLSGAGHRLRHDPRAVALVIGWMEQQATV